MVCRERGGQLRGESETVRRGLDQQQQRNLLERGSAWRRVPVEHPASDRPAQDACACARDVHVQYPPAEMSITLNLLVSPLEARMREQYYFDLGSQTVSGYPDESDTSKRQSFFDIASRIGNADTRQLFDDLSRLHPSPRTRLNATEAVERMDPQAPAWERAATTRPSWCAASRGRSWRSASGPLPQALRS